jgi:hypothetical protein
MARPVAARSVVAWPVAARVALALAAVTAVTPLAGCGGSPPATDPPVPQVSVAPGDRDRLAGLAAAAKDRRFVATYTLSTPRQADRTVTVALGSDGSWVVAVPAGALSGLADIAIFHSAAGLFQCTIGPAAGTAGSRPDLGPLTPGCVKVSGLTTSTDPRVEHLFTDWIDPLVDRATALSVAATSLLPGAQGSCYSVESNSAALTPPVDPGVYCFTADGLLTAARVGFGTVTLSAPAAPAPPAVALPAPIVARKPLPITAPDAPPPPSPSVSPKHV